jgi:DNA repair protein RadC
MSEHNNKLTIKSWAEDDRPREKLLLKGKKSLSDAELLAILIGSGNRNETAVELCKRILQNTQNNLNELAKMNVSELMKYKGIGEAKAISIVAALELGSRREISEIVKRDKIGGSIDVYQLLKPEIADLPYEEFWVIYLNQAQKIIEKMPLSKGGITGTVVDIRLIFKRAIEIYATGIILSHNHPSGNLKPSEEDKKITKKLQQAGDLMQINVIDHIIISTEGYFSFADSNLLTAF